MNTILREADGNYRLPLGFRSWCAGASNPYGLDQGLAKQLREGATLARSIGGWVEIDDRGQTLAGTFNEQTKRSDVPVRLLRMIVNSRETLTRVRLPEEKVGLGARWESRRQIRAYGFNLQRVDTYTLVDRVGDEIMLNVGAVG